MLLLLGSAYALLSLADGMEAVPWMGGLQLSVQQRGTLTFGLAVLVTLREIVALGQQRVLMLVVLESVATAVLGGVVFGGEQLLADRGRHCAIGQMALAVMGLGQLLLLGRECVRVTL